MTTSEGVVFTRGAKGQIEAMVYPMQNLKDDMPVEGTSDEPVESLVDFVGRIELVVEDGIWVHDGYKEFIKIRHTENNMNTPLGSDIELHTIVGFRNIAVQIINRRIQSFEFKEFSAIDTNPGSSVDFSEQYEIVNSRVEEPLPPFVALTILTNPAQIRKPIDDSVTRRRPNKPHPFNKVKKDDFKNWKVYVHAGENIEVAELTKLSLSVTLTTSKDEADIIIYPDIMTESVPEDARTKYCLIKWMQNKNDHQCGHFCKPIQVHRDKPLTGQRFAVLGKERVRNLVTKLGARIDGLKENAEYIVGPVGGILRLKESVGKLAEKGSSIDHNKIYKYDFLWSISDGEISKAKQKYILPRNEYDTAYSTPAPVVKVENVKKNQNIASLQHGVNITKDTVMVQKHDSIINNISRPTPSRTSQQLPNLHLNNLETPNMVLTLQCRKAAASKCRPSPVVCDTKSSNYNSKKRGLMEPEHRSPSKKRKTIKTPIPPEAGKSTAVDLISLDMDIHEKSCKTVSSAVHSDKNDIHGNHTLIDEQNNIVTDKSCILPSTKSYPHDRPYITAKLKLEISTLFDKLQIENVDEDEYVTMAERSGLQRVGTILSEPCKERGYIAFAEVQVNSDDERSLEKLAAVKAVGELIRKCGFVPIDVTHKNGQYVWIRKDRETNGKAAYFARGVYNESSLSSFRIFIFADIIDCIMNLQTIPSMFISDPVGIVSGRYHQTNTCKCGDLCEDIHLKRYTFVDDIQHKFAVLLQCCSDGDNRSTLEIDYGGEEGIQRETVASDAVSYTALLRKLKERDEKMYRPAVTNMFCKKAMQGEPVADLDFGKYVGKINFQRCTKCNEVLYVSYKTLGGSTCE